MKFGWLAALASALVLGIAPARAQYLDGLPVAPSTHSTDLVPLVQGSTAVGSGFVPGSGTTRVVELGNLLAGISLSGLTLAQSSAPSAPSSGSILYSDTGSVLHLLSPVGGGGFAIGGYETLVCGAGDQTSAINTLLSAGGGHVVGKCSTTIAQNAVSGPLLGPGQVETSDGNDRAPIVTQVTTAPASQGNWNSVLTAFNGDLSHVPFAVEQRNSWNFGAPTAGYTLVPETASFASYVYNSGGWNNSTSGDTGRTGLVHNFVDATQAGQGDLIETYFGCLDTGVQGGATSFLANSACSPLAVQLTAGAAGVYLEGIGDIDLLDGGYDASGIGTVVNFNRTNNAGALGTTWIGDWRHSEGTKPIDAGYAINGPSMEGFDTSTMTTGTVAFAAGANQGFYLDATNADPTGYPRYTVPGGTYLVYSTSLGGINVVVGNTSDLQLYGGGNGVIVNTNLRYQVRDQSKTANYTVLTSDSGAHFNNAGASGAVTLSLPAAAAGLTYCFVVDTAETLEVLANGTDKIAIASSNSAPGGNIQNSTPWSAVCIDAVTAGQWVATSETGTWSVN